jgi:transposase
LDEQPVRIESIPKTNFQCSQALDEGGHNERLVTLGRKNSLFAGSDGGARHWAIVASLVATAKLNGVEPLGWLTDVLERMVSGRTKAHEVERLLPWAWKAQQLTAVVNA